MSTAKVEVISTPELLEHILARLPMRDLLVTAPLVCKTWQAVTLSPTLQRALFFEPDPSASVSAKRVQNTLLVEMFSPFFAFRKDDSSPWPGDTDSIMAMPWSKAPDVFKRAEASWRRMLVTQPPTPTVVVIQTSYNPVCASDRRGVLNDVSLRMGGLYDLTLSLVDDATSFRIEWHNDTELEADLTLFVTCSPGCMDEPEPLDERFCSDGAKAVEIAFENWNVEMLY
jgi:hypothetical protein